VKQLRTSCGDTLPSYVHPPRLDAPRRCEREHRLVVPAVSESHTVRVDSGSHTDDLVSHADTEYWFVPLLDCLPQHQRSFHAVGGVTGTIAQEQPVVLIADGVEVVVPGKDGARSATADERSKDICFCTKVEDGDANIAERIKSVGFLDRDLGDEVLASGVPVFGWFWRWRIGFRTNRESAESGTLVA